MTPKEVTPTYGGKAICDVCVSQLRPVDVPGATDCRNDEAEFNSEMCSGYEPVSHEKLADRVAILGNQITIMWDVVMILLDRAEKLPETAP